MDLNTLYDMADKYINFSCKPKPFKKYKIDAVLDEEKSVKWNREEVERLNKKHEDEVKELNRKKNLLYINLVDAIKQYIMSETKVSKARADKIYNYLYMQYHSDGLRECLNQLDDLLELFQ